MSEIEALALRQRDELLAASDRMKTDLALARQEIAQLKGRLETTSAERDHWMRFATELTAKMSVIEMTIADAMVSAKHAMFKPPTVPVPKKTVPVIDTKALEKLIPRLQVNGGADVAKD